MAKAHIEIHHSGRWHLAGIVQVDDPERGIYGRGHFDYHVSYAGNHLQESPDWRAVSCQLPISFSNYTYPHWPAFVLDLLPTGAGRRHLIDKHGLNDGPSADWTLLMHGAGAPPGNLRVREAVINRRDIVAPDGPGMSYSGEQHPGFSRAEIVERGEHFIEYAFAHGALTASASDVQGEAPKFLLVQDHNDRWHAEGAIDDAQVQKHWLVKFPRGNSARDRQVLSNERAYLELARALGLNVGEALDYENNALFIPRFDRAIANSAVIRRGQESLCSVAGIADFGASPPQEQLLAAVANFSDAPEQDIIEFIGRDVANIALGNKDNHARNSALIKLEDGTTRLSPLFDFAPMFLDPEMIPRVCRWQAPLEIAGQPNWSEIFYYVRTHYPQVSAGKLFAAFTRWLAALKAFSATAREQGLDEDIIQMREHSIKKQCQLIEDLLHAQE
ncbi:type II toxin-antitoxin system HipA family toxin [Gilvimarinus xylanilyticus]|uniref:HipA domain-containing protein n=1 Tax=Gilvimarinus xylanilyticus TaxID=2944139 RepID=A0A9X2I635_9GAMM|nr:HipA domain-containing protein [Gilvimarinus xylanilyticus]